MKAKHMLAPPLGRRLFLGLAASAGALALAGCDTASRRYHEKLTLTLDAPEGTVSDSSVTEHDIAFQDGWLSRIGGNVALASVRGQAAVLDLGARGLLFVLLIRDETRKQSGTRGQLVGAAFPDLDRQAQREAHNNPAKSIAYFVDRLNRLKPQGDVPVQALPLLVRFRDPHDPKTVARVDPFDLAASFGPGVKITRVTIQITDEPASTGIERTLPWLVGGALEQRLLPYHGPPRLARDVTQVEDLTYHDITTFDRFSFFERSP